jgi:ABC-type phosphate transport system substrate-binding protein
VNAVRSFLLILLLSLAGKSIAGEMVVIVAAGSSVESLSREQVVNIFMGRYRRLPSDVIAQPYDLAAEDAGKAAFYAGLIGKNLSEVNAYWARLIFSGSTAPPQTLSDTATMLQVVANTPGAIGYVNRSAVNTRVRVVFVVKAP